MARKNSSANVTLELGALKVKLKLFKVLSPSEDVPEPILTHETCRSETAIVDRCTGEECGAIVRQTAPVKTGTAKKKAATAPKVVRCPDCQGDEFEQVHFCGTCDTQIAEDDLEDRLQLGQQTVPVSEDELDAWRDLVPDRKIMRPVGLRLRSMVEAYLRHEAYQVVPDRGHAAGLAAWLKFLHVKQQALIVHFWINKHFKIGALYVAMVKGTPTLFLHTLHSYDDIEVQTFDLPDVPDDVVHQLHDLTAHLRPIDDTIFAQPQAAAFRELFAAKEAGGEAQLVRHGALPGELEALSAALGERLAPPKRKRKAKAKAKPAAAEATT